MSGSERYRDALTRRILVFILLFVIVFLVCEGAVRLLVSLGHAPQGSYIVLDTKYHLARRSYDEDTPALLLLGDSYMNMAVYSELLGVRLEEAGYKADVRNLGNPGSNARMSLFFLKQAVDAGARPRLVLLNLNPAIFRKGQKWESEELLKQSYLGQCHYQPPADEAAKIDCALQKNFFLFRYRGFLRNVVTGFFTTVSKADKNLKKNPWGDKPHVYAEVSPGGWGPGYRIFSRRDLAARFGGEEPQANRAAPKYPDAEWDESSFRALQAYCRERQLPLVLLWFPDYETYRNPKMADEHLAARYRKLVEDSGTYLLDLRGVKLDYTQFYDSSHVNALGAILLTEQLGKALLAEPYRKLLEAPEAGHSSP